MTISGYHSEVCTSEVCTSFFLRLNDGVPAAEGWEQWMEVGWVRKITYRSRQNKGTPGGLPPSECYRLGLPVLIYFLSGLCKQVGRLGQFLFRPLKVGSLG